MDSEKVINCLTDIENIMIARQEICPREELQYWIELQEGVADAIALLKEQEPVPSEMEGGGYNWYPVCGACHGVIGDMDSYCKHCGTPVLKKEIKIHHMRGGVEIEETE